MTCTDFIDSNTDRDPAVCITVAASNASRDVFDAVRKIARLSARADAMPLIKELSRSARTLIPAALEETSALEETAHVDPSGLQRL